ncbi:hypothetical protein K0M31_020386 [Melipona bicolor]|uniref:NADH dehydrogenase [ubiquinone] 1 beta subcomplex subunit 7 n=1 Tax=Melipona bicolor TaxID=60889 RepID=A0AA40G218_9HYME|nr:hypothetical protein K0M31_020386 [Melipona bicolor]
MGNSFQIMFSSDPFPKADTDPTFDPMFGFKGERKKRVEPAITEEALIAAKVPTNLRDYCAHKYLDYQRCYMKEFPFVTRCHDEAHHYLQCEYDDDVLRAKEYERERRLRLRELRKQKALEAAAA